MTEVLTSNGGDRPPWEPCSVATHLPRAGWISMFLLEWLQKQCNHPAQGRTRGSAQALCGTLRLRAQRQAPWRTC